MRSVRRFVAAGLFGLLALPATPAYAHAAYKESNPANKSSVSAPPSEVWADFTEPPAQSSRLEIYDPCGTRVDPGSWNITAYRITTSMSADKQGTYTARFYVTSDLDSHVTTGSFTFTSTGGEPCPGAAEEPEPANEKPSDQGGGADDASGGDGASEGDSDDGSLAAAGADPGDEGSEEAAGSTSPGSSKRKGGKHEGMDEKRQKPHGKGDHKGKSKAKGSKNRNKSSAAGPPVQTDETPPGSGGIPMDWLMISFGIAGAVGAAGGKVYAGLMGGPKP